ncbi:MAG TPA: hypothetical protein VGM19_08610 [Armatimonadota bacterium]
MSNLPQTLVFCLVGLVAVGLLSYMVRAHALDLGHRRSFVHGRLVVFWVACLAAMGLGLYLTLLFPEGLFNVSFTPAASGQPLVSSGGNQPVLLLGLAGMAICALVAWRAIVPLQLPPGEDAEDEDQ